MSSESRESRLFEAWYERALSGERDHTTEPTKFGRFIRGVAKLPENRIMYMCLTDDSWMTCDVSNTGSEGHDFQPRHDFQSRGFQDQEVLIRRSEHIANIYRTTRQSHPKQSSCREAINRLQNDFFNNSIQSSFVASLPKRLSAPIPPWLDHMTSCMLLNILIYLAPAPLSLGGCWWALVGDGGR
jgi:hypothetical protein